jgi:hypothetical protein
MKKALAIAIVAIAIVLGLSALTAGYYFSTNQPKPVPKPIPSQSNFYLPDSKIFVVSATASYGNYPFPTVTNGPDKSPIAEIGELCVIINITLRNDYSYQNPASYILNDTGNVNVALTANLFEDENKISSRDITNAFPINSVFTNRAFVVLSYGETTEITDYIATNSCDVTSFQLVPYYIGEMPPP